MVNMTTVEHPAIDERIDTDDGEHNRFSNFVAAGTRPEEVPAVRVSGDRPGPRTEGPNPMMATVDDKPGDVAEVDLNERLPPRMHALLSDLVRAGGDPHRIPTTDRNELILRLRQAGATYERIADVMGMAVSSVYGVVHKAMTKIDLHNTEQLRAELAADLRMFIDELRPLVHGVNGPFLDDKVGNMFLRAVKAYALLLGLNEPKRTQLTGSFMLPEQNPIAAAYIADLAAWIEAHQAVSVEGNINPPLPPGMDERVNVQPMTNGQVPHGGLGKSKWSMVVEFPAAEDDDEEFIQSGFSRTSVGSGR